MKKVLPIVLFLLTNMVMAASYIKIGDIKGESLAKQKARAGYSTLASQSKVLSVAAGQESTLPDGIYMRSDGKLLKVHDKHHNWIEIQSTSSMHKTNTRAQDYNNSRSNRTGAKADDAAHGLPTGKRRHKPFSTTKPLDKASPKLRISSEDCVDGKVIRGKYKDRKCEHRGHVTVLK